VPEPEAPDRDYTFDGGLELLYDWKGSEIQLQLLTDISGRHKGQEAWLSWALPGRSGRWQWAPSLGLNWKSSQAADYYYGVREDEVQPGLPAYEIDSGVINPFARLSLTYSFDQHWKLVSVFHYEQLDGEIQDSSAVEDDHVSTAFFGLYYEF
jgi:outer membrane protein